MKNQLSLLPITCFLNKVSSAAPVPGGGSVSALYGAIASSLTTMVANLTIDKKNYHNFSNIMKEVILNMNKHSIRFLSFIDKDAEAYSLVVASFKLPKSNSDEINKREQAIEESTLYAAKIPLNIAREAAKMMELIEIVILHGNKNASTDACIAMMSARNAILGASLNVRINLTNLKDKVKAKMIEQMVIELEVAAKQKEEEMIAHIIKSLEL